MKKTSALRAVWDTTARAAYFIVTALVAVLLYIVYLPFGVLRLLCDYRLTRQFYADVRSTLAILHKRWYPKHSEP